MRIAIDNLFGHRIAVIGWPGTGKTTLGKQLAEDLALPYRSTDEVIDLGWSEASLEVSTWLDGDAWIIEGVALPRAFRKWRKMHGMPAPVDRLVHLTKVFRELKPGEVSMGKGIDTVLSELDGWLPAPWDPSVIFASGRVPVGERASLFAGAGVTAGPCGDCGLILDAVLTCPPTYRCANGHTVNR